MKGLEHYLQQKTFTIVYQDTLFGLQWDNLKETRCPICGNKLHLSKKHIYICSGVKHPKPFIIKEADFNKILNKLTH